MLLWFLLLKCYVYGKKTQNPCQFYSGTHCVTNCQNLFQLPTLMHKFFYSIKLCILHYNPRHVSSINMPIFRRTNCIITASGIVTLRKRLYSMPDESRLLCILYCTENDDTRCCDNTICPPEDGHVNVRNMSRIVM